MSACFSLEADMLLRFIYDGKKKVIIRYTVYSKSIQNGKVKVTLSKENADHYGSASVRSTVKEF